MKKKNGFAIKEMIILSGVLAIVFGIAITKISFAYTDALREDEINEGVYHSLIVAAEAYAKVKSEEFKEKETFIYGSDLIDAEFIVENEDLDYKNTKIKVLYDEASKKYKAEIVG